MLDTQNRIDQEKTWSNAQHLVDSVCFESSSKRPRKVADAWIGEPMSSRARCLIFCMGLLMCSMTQRSLAECLSSFMLRSTVDHLLAGKKSSECPSDQKMPEMWPIFLTIQSLRGLEFKPFFSEWLIIASHHSQRFFLQSLDPED